MNFPDKLYVGFNKINDTQELLGFAIPFGTDSKFTNRKGTVDRWSDKLTPITVDNVPTSGFTVVGSVSRASTSNKFYRVKDPRGFQLEVSVENLFDLLQTTVVSKGTFLDQMVWAYGKNGKPYLIESSSEEYKAALRPAEKIELSPGTYYVNKAGDIAYRYEGKFFINLLHASIEDLNYDRNRNWGCGHNRQQKPFAYIGKVKIHRPNKEAVVIFMEFNLMDTMATEDIKIVRRKSINIMRKPGVEYQSLAYLDASRVDEFMRNANLPLNTAISNAYRYGDAEGWNVNCNIGGWSHGITLFETRDAATKRQYSDTEIVEVVKNYARGAPPISREKITVLEG